MTEAGIQKNQWVIISAFAFWRQLKPQLSCPNSSLGMHLLEKLCFEESEMPIEAKLLYQLRSKIKFWNERGRVYSSENLSS